MMKKDNVRVSPSLIQTKKRKEENKHFFLSSPLLSSPLLIL
jgi:hypothetical protein